VNPTKEQEMKKAAAVLAIVLAAGPAAWAAGTVLSLSFAEPIVTCPDGNVSAGYTISTTAAAGATVTETLTNASNVTVASKAYTILPGNVPGGWTFAGRTKAYDGVFEYSGLADGTYSLQVCVTQAGSNGNENKFVCSTETIIVACAAQVVNPCASTGPHGEVVGNDRIGVNAAAQIQFRGDFGPTAFVEITGPNSFYRSASITRNGDSCEYHANWKFTNDNGADFYGNNGEGGNNKTLEFSVTLSD
jgi:hypothetical protein